MSSIHDEIEALGKHSLLEAEHFLFPKLQCDESTINCLQREAWREAIQSAEFCELSTRREQIAFLFKRLCSNAHTTEERWTHEMIAKEFGISRQAAEKQAKKADKGVLEPHRPPKLDISMTNDLRQYLLDHIGKREWLSYPEITEYIQMQFKIIMKTNTVRKMISTKFKDIGKMVEAEPIEDKRFEVSIEKINLYYDKLGSILAFIDFRFLFNLDETGEDEFVDTKTIKVFVPVDFQEKAKIPISRSRKRFTITHCIAADGTFMEPYIIVPRKTFESDVFKIYNPHTLIIRTQPKGFMNEIIFNDYFNNHFVPQLEAKRKTTGYSGPALLIMDNLIAHKKAVNCPIDDDYIFIERLNLHILYLVPHSSDQTQPLDLIIFGLQKQYSQNIKPIPNFSNFANLINKALQGLKQASNERTITSAFSSAGIVRNVQYVNGSVNVKLFVDKSHCRALRGATNPPPRPINNPVRIPVKEQGHYSN